MRRRNAVGMALGPMAAPWLAIAQSPVKRIGYLGLASAQSDAAVLAGFRAGMSELRWAEGRDYTIDARSANGVLPAATGLADELVASAPDLLLVPSEAPGQLLHQRTKAIPIVVAFASDLVANGLAASLRQPAGNVTGLMSMAAELWPKRMQLLKQVVPAASRVGMLFAPDLGVSRSQAKSIESAAAPLGMRLTALEVREVADIEPAFRRGAALGVQAFVVTQEALSFSQRRPIAELLISLKAPAMFGIGQHVDAGGLMSYSASFLDNFRRAAEYVDKIFKGARPGDLPIEQPTRFELLLNLGTAKAIGVTIPMAIQLQADRLIQS